VEERTMCLWTPFGCQVQKKLWNHNFPSLSLSLASAHSKLEDVKTRNFDSKGNQLGRVHHPNQSQYLPTNRQKAKKQRKKIYVIFSSLSLLSLGTCAIYEAPLFRDRRP
jgi:hypothetical protein